MGRYGLFFLFYTRDKFLDEWDDLKIASSSAKKRDKKESVRGCFRKMATKVGERKSYVRGKRTGWV